MWINSKQRKAGYAKNVFFKDCFQEVEERIRSRKVCVYIINGQKTGACQLLKGPSQSEGEGDKISHKNTTSVTSYFLVRMFLSNGSQAMSEFTHSTSVCVCTHVCVCPRRRV